MAMCASMNRVKGRRLVHAGRAAEEGKRAKEGLDDGEEGATHLRWRHEPQERTPRPGCVVFCSSSSVQLSLFREGGTLRQTRDGRKWERSSVGGILKTEDEDILVLTREQDAASCGAGLIIVTVPRRRSGVASAVGKVNHGDCWGEAGL